LAHDILRGRSNRFDAGIGSLHYPIVMQYDARAGTQAPLGIAAELRRYAVDN